MAASTMLLSAPTVAAPAISLSSNVAFGSSKLSQLGAARSSVKLPMIMATRASLTDEERSSSKPQVLVAIIAAGAALALNATPIYPAHAGLFGGDAKVERGATAPDFPGKEGTGTKVGDNSASRGSASSGTPFGEAANGNKVGDNSATRGQASTGTPLGEASKSGSGVSLPGVGAIAEKAKDAVQGGIPSVDPLKTQLGDVANLNPLKNMESPDVKGAASDAKSKAMDVAGDVKSKLPGGN